MEIYYILFFILVFFSLLEVFKIGTIEKKYILLNFSLICLILGTVRYNTGTDWETYYAFFNQGYTYEYFMSDYNFEIGYKFLNYLIKNSADEYYCLLFIISSVCVYSYYRSITYFSTYNITATLILFSAFFYGVFPVRTTIVMAISLLTYRMIAKRNKVGFIITVLLALSIHRIAIILLPAYYLYYKNFSTLKMILIMLICLIVGEFNFIMNLTSYMTGIDSVYLSKLISYAERSQNGEQFGASIDKEQVSNYMIVLKFIFILLLLRYRAFFAKKIYNFNGLINMFFVGSCLYFLLVFTSAEIATRLTGPYTVSEYLLMVNALNISDKLMIKIGIWLIIVASAFVRLYLKIGVFPNAYVPYNTMFGIIW
ncbi:hypothetical protein SELR_05790 [Selenomonas ruminantium subsp. lactilytica TAM6421]|uniref:EpsG family protein n=1 Tax=Selenomonas ruminantium subsp. lactilytica (strain NBRC 103574 / TAM6421) TaxID=927704 RepID=I0GNF0_SELRL|nr:EpsG family protein [Selenomonas ruminantium]BAL82287.1 hypothetical protein SELR_05790 [Selenomonas ruminantium subsp. lactilytica TAM6421]